MHEIRSCCIDVSKIKMDLRLHKAVEGLNWDTLEKQEGASSASGSIKYPTSARKPVDLEGLEEELQKEPVSKDEQVEQFFKQVFKDADEDSRKAMMKSFVNCSVFVFVPIFS